MVSKHQFTHDVELFDLGDVHRGDDACDVPLYLKTVAEIQRNPFARWVSTGDLCNVALATSRSSVYHSANVGKEVELLSEELRPIADKCLGFVSSNHHSRFDRAVGMSLDRLLSMYLGVPYLGDEGSLDITCGRVSYWVHLQHGVGAGRTIGSKANLHDRMADNAPGYDLYLSGHTHSFLITASVQRIPDRKRAILRHLKQWRVTTGHYLNFDESYASKMMLREMPKGCSVSHLRAYNSGIEENKQIKIWKFS